MRRLINRYVVREIAVPFCMVLSILTFVLLMGRILQVMDLMINKGIGLTDIARLMFYLLPSFLMFTIPIAFLIAVLIGLGRISGDNEWIVLKMAGMSLYQFSFPVACAAVVAFLMTLATTVFLVPQGNLASKALLLDLARQKASVGIREKIFIDDFQGILLYVEKIAANGNYLEGVLISDSRIGRDPTTIIARRAYLVSNPDTKVVTLRLEDGSTHTVDARLTRYRKMDFHFYDVRLDLSSALAPEGPTGTGPSQGLPGSKSSTEMSVPELIAALGKTGLKDQSLRELAIELNKKLTVPLSCIVFALIGIPLGIRAHRSVRARGFTLGLLLVLFYYLFRLGGEALVETGRLSPIVGTWTPDLVFAVAGSVLFVFAAREVPLGAILHRIRNHSGADRIAGRGEKPS